MASTKVLITVKTYPTLSTKYEELVCTAGFREDGTWVRIYPVPFRKLEFSHQYRKYDWYEFDLVKNESDFRPESYRPTSLENPGSVTGHIECKKDNWAARKKIVLKKYYDDLQLLIDEAKNKKIATSLAVFKPTKITDFVWKPAEREWSKGKFKELDQFKLFEKSGNDFHVVKKLPYTFSYMFEDIKGKKSKLMIEDWETGALFWKSLRKADGDETKACSKVKEKYLDDFARTKDLYFFLGTTKLNHFRAPNPFVIIGTFHPKKEEQIGLGL